MLSAASLPYLPRQLLRMGVQLTSKGSHPWQRMSLDVGAGAGAWCGVPGPCFSDAKRCSGQSDKGV